MSAEVDVVVIGGGVVGLAVAAALARRGRSLLLLERREGLGRETSSRNSEVIHAGLYYPPGSLKAELCVAGREQVYERCERLGLPHAPLGKLVVASGPAELPRLEALARRGSENGAPGLELISGEEARKREPAVRAHAALVSPRTGIVDAHALMDSFAAEAEAHGATLLTRREVTAIRHAGGRFDLDVRDPDARSERIRCAALVNAAGLDADRIAATAGLDIDALGYRQHPCKGDYFSLAPGAPLRVSQLVYPLHTDAGLGIHATLDLAGRIRFGPDTEYVDTPRYDIDAAKADAFAESAGRYLPELRAEWLTPDYAGVRPKLAGPGQGFHDFVIAEESARGVPGLVDLVGIESPGLTASPAIAERVVSLLASL